MVQAQCKITRAFVDLYGYPLLGLDAKNAAQRGPAGEFSARGPRRAPATLPAALPRDTPPLPHTNALVRASCRATARRHARHQGRRAARADALAPQESVAARTHAHIVRRRRRDGATITRNATRSFTQEGDGIYTRTNGAGLASLEAGATVSVVGRLTGDSSIETSDGVQINLVEPSEAAQTMMPASGCVEVVGTVRDTGSVSPLRVAAFGDDFDLKNYDDLVGLAGDKYAALFR